MDKQTLEPYLEEHAFFKDLSPEHITLLVGCAKMVRFDAGDMIFEHGQPAETFYLIRHGHVAIEIQAQHKNAITIQTLNEGDVLGWSWLLEPYISRFDARAVSLTRALALDGKCLRDKCEADPALGYSLLKRFARVMVKRLEAARMQLLDVYGESGV